ncbi:SH3 domain-containing kinase-binding protein 1 isoform X2 [Betta splendens]|nr:SH3 domain-containing kinase-binding protein 1 isoform X2 [Betta splendens]
MVVVHSYRPHWPDELELSAGDVILVLSKHEEGRWFGRLQGGQRGYFPASCVMELSQVNLSTKGLQRSASVKSSAADNDSGLRARYGNGHILQALRRGSRGGGGAGPEGGRGGSEGPFLVRRPPVPQPAASQAPTHRSPSLLHRILSKCRKKSDRQGATNGAFESD